MPNRFVTTRAGLAALLTMAWALLFVPVVGHYPYPHVFHHDVDSPVIALEISRGGEDIEAVLHRSETKSEKAFAMGTATAKQAAAAKETACKRQAAADSMAWANQLDLVFIPLYAFFLWSLARVFTSRTRLLTLAIVAAAVFDYLEDWRIYQALNGQDPAIFIPSLVKWGLLGLVFVALGGILLRSVSPAYSLPTKRLMAIGFFVSGFLVLLDVALGSRIGYSHIAFGMDIFALLMLVNTVGFLGHYLAIPGMKQTYVEDFCERRKKETDGSLTAVRGERTN